MFNVYIILVMLRNIRTRKDRKDFQDSLTGGLGVGGGRKEGRKRKKGRKVVKAPTFADGKVKTRFPTYPSRFVKKRKNTARISFRCETMLRFRLYIMINQALNLIFFFKRAFLAICVLF